MQKKVARIAESLSDRMSEWKAVVAVVLGETATIETIDPYFSIDLAICHAGELPPYAERAAAAGSPPGFAYSPQLHADLFLLEELPVRILYLERDRLDALLERVQQGDWVFRDETTNILYRIQNGKVMQDREGWLARSREKLARVPDAFWDHLKEGSRVALDRAVADLGAAVHRGDHLFYRLSGARFLQSLCSFLFALNRQFEPSHQMLLERVMKLAKLPAEFSGRLDSLIRPDVEITPARRHEICQLVAKSLSYL
jgi:hypothetical protein